MKICVILCLLSLSSCSMFVRHHETVVPLVIPCKIPSISEPSALAIVNPEQKTIFEKIQILLVELETRKIYEQQLTSAIKTCQ